MDEITEVTPHVQAALECLRNRMNELYEIAGCLGKKHLDFVIAENKNRTWEEKSVLFAQARARDNALTVTWHEVHWYGSKELKTRRMEKRVITKPKTKYGYNMDTLLKHAKPWELELVSEVEQQLIPLRREAAFIAKAIGQLNHIGRGK